MVGVVAVGAALVVVAVVVAVVVEKYCIVISKMMSQLFRASEAMHKIFLMQVLFDCNECKERFDAFHSAYELSEEVAKLLEIFWLGKFGLAFGNVQVTSWHDILATLEHHEDSAAHHY